VSITAVGVLGLLALVGCSPVGGTGGAGASDQESTAVPLRSTVQVYAAASLTAAFDELAAEFELEHPEVDVLPIVYGGSSTLAIQILEGAPADVFASADESNMVVVVDSGLSTGSAAIFASNTLVVALAPGNPGKVETLADLAGTSVVLCAPKVPCGRAAQALLDNAGVTLTPVSFEQHVTAVLQKVALGEVNAGLVYATDVAGVVHGGTAGPGATAISSFVPEGASSVVNSYPITALRDATDPDAAARFVEFVLGKTGLATLSRHGFGER